MTRRTLAPGIYEDQYGREIRWVEGRTRSKRFPLDAPLEDLKAYRARMVRQAGDRRKATAGGSFVRDLARWLRTRKTKPCYGSDRSHLKPWAKLFRRGSRFAIERADVQQAIHEWAALRKADGTPKYSPRELRHRLKLLQQVFRWLDPGQPTPCDGVKLPKVSTRKPRPVADAMVRRMALALREQERLGRLRNAKTRARYLMLMLTGVRPAQLKRAKLADVDADLGIWYVEPAKGDDGTVVVFNADMRKAWDLFVGAGAFGAYDSSSFAKTLQRNGWPKGVRPYNLRHKVGQTLRELGAPLDDIQQHLGHKSPVTTDAFYLVPSLARMTATSARLDGRVDALALEPLPRATTTRSEKQKAKRTEITEQSAPPAVQEKSRLKGRLATKSA